MSGLKDAIDAYGTLVSCLIALFAASSVTVSQPARSLLSASAFASPAMWPGSVRRLGAPLPLFLVLLLMASPSSCYVASVPVSAQFAPSAVPNTDESGHAMEELSHSSPKGPAVSAPVSVHAQSVTVSAAPATVTLSASPATVPVSVTVSAAPATVTTSVPTSYSSSL